MTPDHINACFELFGGLLLFINCYKIIQHREVRGYSFIPVVFFTLWGYWNLYYYPHLGQPWSFLGGIVVVSANTAWLSLFIFYKVQNNATTKKHT